MIGYRETKTVNSNAIDILLTEASAPIRWRLEREILGRDRPKTVRKSDLMGWSPVRKNLELLTGDCRFNWLHSSMDMAFENICGELTIWAFGEAHRPWTRDFTLILTT